VTVLPVDFDLEEIVYTPPQMLEESRGDGLVQIQMIPTTESFDDYDVDGAAGATQMLVPASVIVNYISAAAKRAARDVKNKEVLRDPAIHLYHPSDVTEELVEDEKRLAADPNEKVWESLDEKDFKRLSKATCVHCAVMGASVNRTLGAVLMMLLESKHTSINLDWHRGDKKPGDVALIKGLKELAVSESQLAGLFGENWAAVIFFAMRAEAADFGSIYRLAQGQPRMHEPFLDLRAIRYGAAAAYLGGAATPRRRWDEPGQAPDYERTYVQARLSVALSELVGGKVADWLNYLPEPIL